MLWFLRAKIKNYYFLQLTNSKHYCGICKKIWNHSDSGSWVREHASELWF